MSSGIEVDEVSLSDAAEDWTVQAARVEAAATRLAGASTGGFGPGVKSTANSFTQQWETITRDSAKDADDLGNRLSEALQAYLQIDMEAQREFESWLAKAGGR
jgi:hypothetical protein